jgi:hypothetical protein
VVNTAIDQGSSITLVVLANVPTTNFAASAGGCSILQVSLNDFSNVTKKAMGWNSGESRLSWNDKDSGATASFKWIEYPESAINSTTYHG